MSLVATAGSPLFRLSSTLSRRVILRLALVLLLPLLLASVVSSPVVEGQERIEPVAIEIDGKRIELAPADADAFQRRLNKPPQLETLPAASAPSFPVITAYWDSAVEKDDDEGVVEAEAEYFPSGGFVRAQQSGLDVWLVLDLRQRAILDRYIRFGIEDSRQLPRPGALELVRFASKTETVGIETGDRLLTESEARSFWDAFDSLVARASFNNPAQPPMALDASGYWLTFSLPEGRAQQYFLDTASGMLADSLGTESYDFSGLIGRTLPGSAAALPLEQQDPTGSALWWLLAIGGGIGLLAIAVWLRLRNSDRT